MINIRYAVLCDEARKEDNGKHFLIGVYGPDILVPAMPTTVGIAMVLAIDTDEPWSGKVAIKVEQDNDQRFSAGGSIGLLQSGEYLIPFPQFPLEIKNDKDLTFSVRIEDADWKRVRSLRIGLR